MAKWLTGIAAAALLLLASAATTRAEEELLPERVTCLSGDGKTMLVGYVYKPARMPAPRVPAVVMMHGRAGAYSSLADGVFDASTISRRHRQWGRIWAEQGYIAMLVDGFGPRGYPTGFARGTFAERPPEVNEVTMRPLDAYGALACLRQRPDVIVDRIGLFGWSNGGSATLSAMAGTGAPGGAAVTPVTGFRAALAFYPACRLRGRFDRGYRPYAPLRLFHGTADDETSARRCLAFVHKARATGGEIAIRLYDDATHGFDDPTRKRQRLPANAAARQDAIARAVRFFAEELGRP
jgi:carboxymethylenebutenolidase